MVVPIDTFDTARLRAERLVPAHRSEVQRLHDDPVYMALLGGVRNEEQTSAYMEFNLAHWDRYGFGLWMLRDLASDTLIGRACVRHFELEGTDEVEIGYGFGAAHWGRGLATEVATACLRLGRERLGLQSMIALTLPHHRASQHVMTKVGMVFDRRLDHGGVPHVVFRTRPL